MFTKIKTRIKRRYYNTAELEHHHYKISQKNMILSGTTASIINTLTAGSFLVGYLSYLGASPGYCAIIAAIPQLGCILQMFSPYVFERLKHRKLLICLCCFVFRFSVSTIIFVPYLFDDQSMRLSFIMVLHTFAFMIAGFVTPGLSNWYLSMAPEEGRGKFLAIKDMGSMLSVSLVSLLISRMLDHYDAQDRAMIGFSIMFAFAMVLSIVDFILLSGIEEPSKNNEPLRSGFWQLVLAPLRDTTFRKFIVFLSIWNFAIQFSVTFIPIFMLSSLGLSYSFISVVTITGNIVGMIAAYIWGRLADSTSWKFVLRTSAIMIAFCYFGWFFVTRDNAKILVLLLQVIMICCNGAFMMATNNLLYFSSPAAGKTAYIGVTQAIACVISFAGVVLGTSCLKQIQAKGIQIPYLQTDEMQILFLITGSLLIAALLSLRKG